MALMSSPAGLALLSCEGLIWPTAQILLKAALEKKEKNVRLGMMTLFFRNGLDSTQYKTSEKTVGGISLQEDAGRKKRSDSNNG